MWVLVLAFTTAVDAAPNITVHKVFNTKTECVQNLNHITTSDLWDGHELLFKWDSEYTVMHKLKDKKGTIRVNECQRPVNE